MGKKLESNYDRNIFEQLYEALETVEKLEKEVSELKTAHRLEIYSLSANKARIENEVKEHIEKDYEIIKQKARKEQKERRSAYENEIYFLHAYYEKGIAELTKARIEETGKLNEIIWSQSAEIARLKEENAGLRSIMNQNSGNSSRPPSSDVYKKIHNSRTPTGKKVGGQYGHRGHQPVFFTNPTEIIEIKAKKCSCGGNYEYTENNYAKKQLADIEITTNIIEYREYKGKCDCCGSKSHNRSPVNDVITYGNKIKSLVNMLSVEGNVSINRIGQMITEITGGIMKLSEGTICKWQRDLCKLLAPSIQSIKEKLLVSPVLNKDETGIWVESKLNWLHVLSNDTYSLFYANAKRGKEADIEAGVLPAYKGVLEHDNFKSLYHFTCVHAECNAHILRYLKGVVENKNRKWAEDMIQFFIKAKAAAEEKELNSTEIYDFHSLYDEILENGRLEFLQAEKSDYNGDDIKLLRRLNEYKTQHLLFLSDRNVPFDNNQAERDLRMIKAKTKISGCFRSSDGGSVFAILKSYTASLRKNALSIFDGIFSAWNKKPVLF